MESTGNYEQDTTDDEPILDSSEALSGLLSVVNALCKEKTETNYDENDDIHNDDINSDVHNDDEVGDGDACDDDDVDNDECVNDDANDADDCSGKGSCLLESAPIFNKEKQANRDDHFSNEVKDAEMATFDPSQCSSPSVDSHEQIQYLKRPKDTQASSLPPTKRKQTIDVPTYSSDETRIIAFPDVYTAIRRACGTCSSLRSKINKLGIVAKRFQPWEMTRLKHIGAVGLEVKCCSYIHLEEFIQIIQNYKEVSVNREVFNFLPAVNISSTTSKSFVDEKIAANTTSPGIETKYSSLTSGPIHTFLVNDEVVVCTVELQQVFESLFGKVFCTSLTKLGVFQKKFNPFQLDEVMDFVDIDESSVASACFYVTKKDGERVFRYAEALFNVDQITVKWMEPLKLSGSASDEESFSKCKDGSATLERSTLSIPAFSRSVNLDSFGQSTSEGIDIPRNVTGAKTDEAVDYCLRDSSSEDSANDSPSNDEKSENLFETAAPSQQLHVQKTKVDDISTLASFPLEKSPSSSSYMDAHDNIQLRDLNSRSLQSSVDPTNVESQLPTSSSCVILTNEECPSSPDSEASSISDLGSFSSIRTYQIDGNEVVCIPDIHKIVIHLYGQSVQVGYYLQRLQIPTQRFSTVHVKRLKALNALNSKATLCTYILKSDAQRLLKMYDVFCTESKLQLIQWSNPISLEVFEGTIHSNIKEDVSVPIDSLKPKATDPIDVVKIPTFQINGEVVVSVPDAHKVVQVLNGQSVQVRYNMDKLGIVKRKYSYSQVYQLRAISDLKRPSMCTFITKMDADKLLAHYLTSDNADRLNYIQWLPPVQLEELNTGVENVSTSQDVCSAGKSLSVEVGNSTKVGSSGNQTGLGGYRQESDISRRTSEVAIETETITQDIRGHTAPLSLPSTSEKSYATVIGMSSSVVVSDSFGMSHYSSELQQNCKNQDLASHKTNTFDSNIKNDDPLLAKVDSRGHHNQGTTSNSSCSGPLSTRPETKELYNQGTTSNSSCSGPLSTRPETRELYNQGKTSDSSSSGPLSTRAETRGLYNQGTRSVHSETASLGRLLTAAEAKGPYIQSTSCAYSSSASPGLSTRVETRRSCDQSTGGVFSETRHPVAAQSYSRKKRSHDELRDTDSLDLEIKRLKAEKDDIVATLERKETEMKILHDAYQQQVACEREKRLKADKEAAELRASNEELKKNLQRKESEMKILHDSYQYQIRKEREKREEMENDLTDLRGSVAFASGVAVRESNIKQEKL